MDFIDYTKTIQKMNNLADQIAKNKKILLLSNLATLPIFGFGVYYLGGTVRFYSFLVGWIVSTVNLWFLIKIIGQLFKVFLGEENQSIPVGFYFYLIGKFIFWGFLLYFFMHFHWIEPIAFVIGISTLIVSAMVAGVKELIYAR